MKIGKHPALSRSSFLWQWTVNRQNCYVLLSIAPPWILISINVTCSMRHWSWIISFCCCKHHYWISYCCRREYFFFKKLTAVCCHLAFVRKFSFLLKSFHIVHMHMLIVSLNVCQRENFYFNLCHLLETSVWGKFNFLKFCCFWSSEQCLWALIL